MDQELLGKCGYYCGQCPSYLAGKCKVALKKMLAESVMLVTAH